MCAQAVTGHPKDYEYDIFSTIESAQNHPGRLDMMISMSSCRIGRHVSCDERGYGVYMLMENRYAYICFRLDMRIWTSVRSNRSKLHAFVFFHGCANGSLAQTLFSTGHCA